MYRRVLTRVVLSLLIIVGGGFTVFMAIGQFGLVVGEEFAPDTFQRRSYWYYELPLIGLKVTPVKRKVSRNQLENMLIAKKYITMTTPPDRWDLVYAVRGEKVWRQGEGGDSEQLSRGVPTGQKYDELLGDLGPRTTRSSPRYYGQRSPFYAAEPVLLDSPVVRDCFGAAGTATTQAESCPAAERAIQTPAETQVELGKLESAVQYYSEALRHDPDRRLVWRGVPRAMTNWVSQAKPQRTVEQFPVLRNKNNILKRASIWPGNQLRMIIDLDHNATTPIHPEVAQVMAECYLQGFGNAVSSHRHGRRARQVLEDAREGTGGPSGANMTGVHADNVWSERVGHGIKQFGLVGVGVGR